MIRRWTTGFWLLALTCAVQAESLTGRVTAVVDGDTLLVRAAGRKPIRVRLAGIDAPEHDQPWGASSRRLMARLALNRTATVTVQKLDDYGRIVGQVTVGGMNVETEQVRQGLAWVYRQYHRDPRLLALEAEARAARRGLWADSAPIPPWDWRHRRSAAPPASTARAATGRCGEKRVCREMTSCEEARFYLTDCGLTRLDGDRDGTPCEALCRPR